MIAKATPEEDARIIAKGCHHCDFSMGTRGMDRCARCDGTGSVFWVYGRSYPNTEAGFHRALTALRNEEAAALSTPEGGTT